MSIFTDIDIDHKLRLQYVFHPFLLLPKISMHQTAKCLQEAVRRHLNHPLITASCMGSSVQSMSSSCRIRFSPRPVPHGSRARFWWQQWTKQEQTRSGSTTIVTRRVSDEAHSETSLEMTFKRRPRRQFVCPKPRLGLQKPAARWCEVGQQLGRQKQSQWLCLVTYEGPSLASHTNGRCRWR